MFELSAHLWVGDRLEDELLICCARTQMDAKTAARTTALLQENIDWIYLLSTARAHGMMPLLYLNLSTIGQDIVPSSTLHVLQDYFDANERRNCSLTAELLRLLELFKADDISVIAYKGPILAALAYGNIALRQFSDLDILVCQQDIAKAKHLLLLQGYQLKYDFGWEYHFVHADSNINVDLHQALAPASCYFPLTFERLWSRLASCCVAGATVGTLPPEYLLLLLCMNWTKDCCQSKQRLAQLCDIAELLRTHPGLDWQQLLAQARTLGSERLLCFSLLLATELLGISLPAQVCNRIQAHPVLKSLAHQMYLSLLSDANEPPGTPETKTFLQFLSSSLPYPYRHGFYLLLRERWRDRARYCLYWLQIMFTPNQNDWTLLPLPWFLYFLYYPLHLIRLLVKHRLILWRSVTTSVLQAMKA